MKGESAPTPLKIEIPPGKSAVIEIRFIDSPAGQRAEAAARVETARAAGSKGGRAFEQYPLSCQEEARKRLAVVQAYFNALEQQKAKNDCEHEARIVHLRLYRRDCSPWTVRRWIQAMEAAGHNIHNAPLSAFLSGKSTPHLKARKLAKAA